MAREYKADQVLERNIVSMEFDNKKFNRKVKETEAQLQDLKREMSFADVDYSDAEKGLNKIALKFDGLRIAAETAIYRITNSAINAGEKMVKALSIDNIATGYEKYTQKVTAVQTMMAADSELTLERINAQMAKLQWFTDETSYDLASMQGSMAKFMATGMKLEDAAQSVQGIALWAAEAGQNAQTASNAMYQLSQAMGRGVIKWQDWMSIVTANMSTEAIQGRLIEAGKEMGTITGSAASKSFQELMSAGAFTTEVFAKVMKDYTEFSDYIYDNKDAYDTTSEAIRELGDAWAEANQNGTAFSKTAMEAAQVAKTFREAIDSVKTAVASGWSQSLEAIIGDYTVVKDEMTDVAEILWEIFNGTADARNATLTEWAGMSRGGRADLWQGLKNILNTILNIVQTMRDAWHEVFPPKTAQDIADLVSKFKDFTQSLLENKKVLTIIKFVTKEVAHLLNVLLKVLKIAWSVAQPLLEFAAELALSIGELVAQIFGVDTAVGGIAGTIDSLISSTTKLSEIVKKFIARLKEAWAVVNQFVKNATGKNIREWIIEFANFFRTAIEILAAFLTGFNGDVEGKQAFVDKLLAFAERLGTGFKFIYDEFISLIEPVLGEFKAAGTDLISIFNTLLAIIAPLVMKILDWFKGMIHQIAQMDPQQLATFILTIAAIIFVIRKALKIKWLLQIAEAFGDIMWQIAREMRANTFKVMATAILEIVAALWLLTKIDLTKLKDNLIALAVAFTILYSLTILMGYIAAKDIKSTSRKIFALSIFMIAFAGAFLMMANAFNELASIELETYKGIGVAAGIITGCVSLLLLVSSYSKLLAAPKLLIFILMLPLIISALTRVLDSLKSMADTGLDYNSIMGLLAQYGAILLGFSIFVGIVGKFIGGKALMGVISVIVVSWVLVTYFEQFLDLLNRINLLIVEFKKGIDKASQDATMIHQYVDGLDYFSTILLRAGLTLAAILTAVAFINKSILNKSSSFGKILAMAALIYAFAQAIAVVADAFGRLITTMGELELFYRESGTEKEQTAAWAIKTARRTILLIMGVVLGLVLVFTAIMIGMARMSKVKPEIAAGFSSRLAAVAGLLGTVALVVVALAFTLISFFEMINKLHKEGFFTLGNTNGLALLQDILNYFALAVLVIFLFISLITASLVNMKADKSATFAKSVAAVAGLIAAITVALVGIAAVISKLTDVAISVHWYAQDKLYQTVLTNLIATIGGFFVVTLLFASILTGVAPKSEAAAKGLKTSLNAITALLAVMTLMILAIGLCVSGVVIAVGDSDAAVWNQNTMTAIYTMLIAMEAYLGTLLAFAVVFIHQAKGASTAVKAESFKMVLNSITGLIGVMTLMFISVGLAILGMVDAAGRVQTGWHLGIAIALLSIMEATLVTLLVTISHLVSEATHFDKKTTSQSVARVLTAINGLIATFALLILSIATTILGLVEIASQINTGWRLGVTIALISVTVAVLGGIITAMLIFIDKLKDIKNVNQGMMISGVLTSLTAFVASLAILMMSITAAIALIAASINKFGWLETLTAFLLVGGILSAIVGLLRLISNMDLSKAGAGGKMVILSAAMSIIIGSLVTVFAAISLMLYVIGKYSLDTGNALPMINELIVILTIMLVVMSLLLSHLSKKAEFRPDKIWSFAGSLAVLVVAMSAILAAISLVLSVIAQYGLYMGDERIALAGIILGGVLVLTAIIGVFLAAISKSKAIDELRPTKMLKFAFAFSLMVVAISSLLVTIAATLQIIAVYKITAVEMTTLGSIILMLCTMLIVITGALLLASMGMEKFSSIRNLAIYVIGFAVMIAALIGLAAAMTAVLAIIPNGEESRLWLVGIILSVMLLVMSLIMLSVSSMLDSLKGKNGKIDIMALVSTVLIFATIAGVIWVLCKAVSFLIDAIENSSFEYFVVAAASILLVLALTALIIMSMAQMKTVKIGSLLSAVPLLLAVGAIVSVIAIAMGIMIACCEGIDPSIIWACSITVLLMITVVSGIMLALGYLFSANPLIMAYGAAGLAIIAGFLFALAAAITDLAFAVDLLISAFTGNSNLMTAYAPILNGSVATGLAKSIEEVKAATDEMGQTIVDTLVGDLDEHSPSKVGEQIGKFFGIGVANGILDGTENVESAMQSLGDTIVNIGQTIGDEWEHTWDELSVIGDKFGFAVQTASVPGVDRWTKIDNQADDYVHLSGPSYVRTVDAKEMRQLQNEVNAWLTYGKGPVASGEAPNNANQYKNQYADVNIKIDVNGVSLDEEAQVIAKEINKTMVDFYKDKTRTVGSGSGSHIPGTGW